MAISGLRDKDAFVESSQKGGVCFPILSSVRVLVSPEKENQPGHTCEPGASEHGRQLNAIVMEAAEQDITPKSIPNAALL